MKNYFQAPWSIKDLVIICIAAALLMIALPLIIKFSGLLPYFNITENDPLFTIFGFFLQWVIILTPFFILTFKKYKAKGQDFGFLKIGIGTFIKEILKAYFVFLGISLIIGILIIEFDLKIPGYQVQENIIPLFGDNTFGYIVGGLIVVVLAPVFEEIFFRGFLLRALSNKIGVYLGSIVSALMFALVHFPWQSIIPIFILGLIINSIVIRTKNIWPAIGFHIFNNGIVFLIQMLVVKDVISIEKLT